MDHTYWHKQTAGRPLFPDLLWSRPENRQLAGKLLIAGGNAYGFAAPAEAYGAAAKAGIGTARVLLPDAIKPYFPRFSEATLNAPEWAPSTPSGSFSQRALDGFLLQSAWADGVLLAGDLGRNSETAILLEQFIQKHTGQLTITKDAADYAVTAPQSLLTRPDTTLVISLAQLQKLAVRAHFPRAFTFGMDLLRLVDALHELSERYPINIIVKHLDMLLVAANGQISSTELAAPIDTWRVATAAQASVWWLQSPRDTFQALTTALIEPKSV